MGSCRDAPIYLLGSDFVFSEGFAGDDVGGDGSSVGGAGDFDFTDFLIFAVDEESLVDLGHWVQGEIEDDKSQGRVNRCHLTDGGVDHRDDGGFGLIGFFRS